ncbi:dihydrolipoamide acetyltransferase family protein [Streptomyces kanamyceticus]|uniref:Dihydrolipoamide acetyltransferase component of pyruvate dehydrogenase complex n=1 Tax=Streptomyces kanamyceticus TaxID=1967 RepID=A0A5J6GD22_STRKN|nr:dihydrolipoamide acetyltransferase family protein [Streptomyces kanamyceticus]QEU93063.1 2-oxo acid dehydrogenase subunit E2 [Streptomyces kanamyceticus]
MAPAFDVNSLEFKLPDLGEGLTEAEIVRWLVQVGDVVAVDQPVVEVETAKAMVEVPCPYGGVVTARFGDEGAELPVGAPLLTVTVGSPAGSGSAGAPEEPAERALLSAARSPALSAAEESSGNVLVGYGTAAAPARRRRVRPAAPQAVAAPQAAAPPEPVTSPEPVALSGRQDPARGDGPIPVISPLVRKLARENGVDLRVLVGSGHDGLITRADVEGAIAAGGLARHGAGQSAGGTREESQRPGSREDEARGRAVKEAVREDDELIREGLAEARRQVEAGQEPTRAGIASRHPLTGIRGLVADKMSRSRREIPEATCWVDADATELLAARAAMNGAMGPRDGQKVSLLALFARITVAALDRYPMLNSTVDMEAREVRRLADIHLGFAAQTDRGLVVPVVRHSQTRTTTSINGELIRLTEAAREGTLTPAELTGGTFTLNNYGVFGVDGSTPIINHPEAAMLGVGRIVPKPWVHQGELAVRHVVQLSLTFDHRVCDGGTAGGFLRYVADCVEQPAVLLRSV